jgi:hypothetical protein
MSYQKPFIPAWLDDAKLSQAEFRVFCHLCRSADNSTGVAWPSYKRMIEKCQLSKSTIRRCIEELENRKLISKIGKPFGGSCRYRVLPIVPPEGQMEVANSSTREPIEPPPIVPPENRNSPSHGTPIVPPEGQEGNPIKVLQGRKSTKAASPPFEATVEEIQFADWFKSSLPQNEQERLVKNWRTNFSKTYRQLLNIDKRTPEEIRRVCQWARTDSFWQTNFKSPSKLRDRNGQGVLYFDVFLDRMTSTSTQPTKPQTPIKTGSRTSDIEIL